MLAFQRAGCCDFDYGNNICAYAREAGVETPSTFPASCPRSSARCSARARGRFVGAALSGDPEDIARIDRAILELFPEDEGLQRWIQMPPRRCRSRDCPRGFAGSATATGRGQASTSTSSSRAARWPRRSSSVATTSTRIRGQPQPRDRGDARWLGCDRRLADPQRPREPAAGATWVSFHHGGGVGIG